ncbi:MAG TPA: glutathione peroxidase [Aromatoleum sp.]|uniref:glutathione peroxidase n=1 Tax=Aromatoleum sp. TaxID=2307007 RepID=UPI002B48A190|nr:glutathione peroxidase [Aromatoleum sp.]HJV27381.1 glutathione peroxidase [Aromatoleum sp.]
MDTPLYDFEVERLTGGAFKLGEYAGKVLLIVNTASECGFTPQYAGLEKLYETYRDRGFVVLGFPCNQFGAQEPGNAEQIAGFCAKNYEVSFPMFAKIDVNGEKTHPLYTWLKKHAKGVLGTEAIKWNFTKFLVDRSGTRVERFAPRTTPESITGEIEARL